MTTLGLWPVRDNGDAPFHWGHRLAPDFPANALLRFFAIATAYGLTKLLGRVIL